MANNVHLKVHCFGHDVCRACTINNALGTESLDDGDPTTCAYVAGHSTADGYNVNRSPIWANIGGNFELDCSKSRQYFGSCTNLDVDLVSGGDAGREITGLHVDCGSA